MSGTEDRWVLARRLADIAFHASGGRSTDSDEDFVEALESGRVREEFERIGMGWSPLLERDVSRVLSGEPPRYFMNHFDWAETYRARRGIFSEGPGSDCAVDDDIAEYIFSPGQVAQLTLEYIDGLRNEQREYGVSMVFYKHGYACFNEARYFYGTTEWRDRAKAARHSAGYRCEACGIRTSRLHVHHYTPIVSAFSPNFCLNFAAWKLRVLCPKCHRDWHRDAVRDCLLSTLSRMPTWRGDAGTVSSFGD
jgi:hypothetical protein